MRREGGMPSLRIEQLQDSFESHKLAGEAKK